MISDEGVDDAIRGILLTFKRYSEKNTGSSLAYRKLEGPLDNIFIRYVSHSLKYKYYEHT